MAVILSEKEVEVGSRVFNHSDFIILIDKVAIVFVSRDRLVLYVDSSPESFQICGVDRILW